MASCAEFNFQDRLFFAYDRALRRMGLPGFHIQVHMRMRGQIDVQGLKETLRTVYQVYPAAGGRLACNPMTGAPKWKLGGRLHDFDRVVRIHALAPPTEDELHRRAEDLLATPMNTENLPPLQFHVFRGLSEGDVVILRWPHAFMDARGHYLLVEEIEKLYRDRPHPHRLMSAGDEDRRDYARLIGRVSLVQRLRMLASLKHSNPRQGRIVWLPREPLSLPLGRIRYLVRCLSPEQARQAQLAAMSVCGFARFGDFIRSCAIRTMHRLVRHSFNDDDVYSTANVFDHRKRRQRAPICHNLFSAIPMYVAARLAADRKAVAESFRAQTETMLSPSVLRRHLVLSSMVSRLPISLLAGGIQRSASPRVLAKLPAACLPPSVQLGYSGESATYLPTFCGATRQSTYGSAIPAPLSGFALDLNITGGRMCITSTWFESRVPFQTMKRFVDDFAAALLEQN